MMTAEEVLSPMELIVGESVLSFIFIVCLLYALGFFFFFGKIQ